MVYPKAVLARVHPNSFDSGFKKTEIEPIVPKERAVNVKTLTTITQPYMGSLSKLFSVLNLDPF